MFLPWCNRWSAILRPTSSPHSLLALNRAGKSLLRILKSSIVGSRNARDLITGSAPLFTFFWFLATKDVSAHFIIDGFVRVPALLKRFSRLFVKLGVSILMTYPATCRIDIGCFKASKRPDTFLLRINTRKRCFYSSSGVEIAFNLASGGKLPFLSRIHSGPWAWNDSFAFSLTKHTVGVTYFRSGEMKIDLAKCDTRAKIASDFRVMLRSLSTRILRSNAFVLVAIFRLVLIR